MKTIETPNNIDVLIHYHCSPEPHPRVDAPAIVGAIEDLTSVGALEVREGKLRTTKMGEAWLKALCKVPPPRQAWVDAHGNVLIVI